MAPINVQERAERAEQYYRDHLKDKLEATHRDSYVAIEPDSGDYFLGATDDEATAAARQAHPDKVPHLIHIGHAVSAYILGVRW